MCICLADIRTDIHPICQGPVLLTYRLTYILYLEREREIFIQLHIRNTFKIYKLNTKQSCAHSSQKSLP